MKIIGLSYLFKQENSQNWWLTKYLFCPTVYGFILSLCNSSTFCTILIHEEWIQYKKAWIKKQKISYLLGWNKSKHRCKRSKEKNNNKKSKWQENIQGGLVSPYLLFVCFTSLIKRLLFVKTKFLFPHVYFTPQPPHSLQSVTALNQPWTPMWRLQCPRVCFGQCPQILSYCLWQEVPEAAKDPHGWHCYWQQNVKQHGDQQTNKWVRSVR